MHPNNNHWSLEYFKERMTRKAWKEILLSGNDRIFVKGRMRQLKASHIGAGIYEVTKEPLHKRGK